MSRETAAGYDLMRGIWKENPVLIQMLGLCPALAVTSKARLAGSRATSKVMNMTSAFL